MASAGDKLGQRIIENTYIEKFDKTFDPPKLIETIHMQNGVVVDRKQEHNGEETEAGAEASPEASHVFGQGSQEVGRALKADPWRVIACAVQAANETGIEVERAMRLISRMSELLRQPPTVAAEPSRKM